MGLTGFSVPGEATAVEEEVSSPESIAASRAWGKDPNSDQKKFHDMILPIPERHRGEDDKPETHAGHGKNWAF